MRVVESEASIKEVGFVIDSHPIDKFKAFRINHDNDIAILEDMVLLFGTIAIEFDNIA